MDTFLGEKIEYWMALQKRVEELDVRELIREIAELHGKVGFYERRIKTLTDFMNSNP